MDLHLFVISPNNGIWASVIAALIWLIALKICEIENAKTRIIIAIISFIVLLPAINYWTEPNINPTDVQEQEARIKYKAAIAAEAEAAVQRDRALKAQAEAKKTQAEAEKTQAEAEKARTDAEASRINAERKRKQADDAAAAAAAAKKKTSPDPAAQNPAKTNFRDSPQKPIFITPGFKLTNE